MIDALQDTQSKSNRFELGELVGTHLIHFASAAASRVDDDPARRQVLVALALAMLGSIGAELTTRSTFTIEELPQPDDAPDVIRQKAIEVMRKMDRVLNASTDRGRALETALRELFDIVTDGDAPSIGNTPQVDLVSRSYVNLANRITVHGEELLGGDGR